MKTENKDQQSSRTDSYLIFVQLKVPRSVRTKSIIELRLQFLLETRNREFKFLWI